MKRDLEALLSTSLESHGISSQRRLALGLSSTDTEASRRLVFHELRRRGWQLPAEKFCTCRSLLTRRNCEGDSHHPLFNPIRCDLRVCAWCAQRMVIRQVAAFMEAIEALDRQGALNRGRATNRPSFKHLVLTLAPRKDMPAAVRELGHAWRRLQLLVGFERDKNDGLFGAIATVQVGPHRNVHMHVLYWGRFVPQSLLAERWRQVTGDSYIVHVAQVKGGHQGIRAAVREVCNYIARLSDAENQQQSRDQEPSLPEVLIVDVYEAIRGRRRVATYGLFYNVNVAAERPPLVCEECGAPLRYVGTSAPEHLQPWELEAFLERLRRPPGVAA